MFTTQIIYCEEFNILHRGNSSNVTYHNCGELDETQHASSWQFVLTTHMINL